MHSSISKESTPFSSKQSFVRVDRRARDASIGPHSGLVGKIQAAERRDRITRYRKASESVGKIQDDDIYSVISELSSTGSVEAFGTVRRTRPLSPVRMRRGDTNDDDERSFYSSTASGRELRARASPYLKHLGERAREEMLMELGSVSLSSDSELNAEMQLKAILKAAVGESNKPTRSPIKIIRTNNKAAANKNKEGSSSGPGVAGSTGAGPKGTSNHGNTRGKGGNRREGSDNVNSGGRPGAATLNSTMGTADMSDVSDMYDDENTWWSTGGFDTGGFVGVSDEYTDFVMDLSPSVSTASSDHSWSRSERGADMDYTFARTGSNVPEDY